MRFSETPSSIFLILAPKSALVFQAERLHVVLFVPSDRHIVNLGVTIERSRKPKVEAHKGGFLPSKDLLPTYRDSPDLGRMLP